MGPQRTITRVAALAVKLILSVSACAGAARTFVSTIGNDANTSANCSPSAPCRTFSAALSVTSPGGEVVVLTSGGYGPATITQPVVITAIGVDASITQADPVGAAITINTSGNVTIIGLNLHGEGAGFDGVLVQEAGSVRLHNMLIENFTQNGVELRNTNSAITSSLQISGSSINENQENGLLVFSPGSAYVHNTSFNHNLGGVYVVLGQATVADSSAEYNNAAAFDASGVFPTFATITLINDRVTFNGTGMLANLYGILYFANCLIANNSFSYIVSGGTISGTNPGTSFIAPGQMTSGTLSAPITLQ